MSTRKVALAVAIGSAVILCCGGGVALSQAMQPDTQPASVCGAGSQVDPTGPMPQVAELEADQVRNAAWIVATGQQMNVPPRGWIIAIATAMQESTLHNYGDLGKNNDHDSLGLFQQRPSQGWGTPAQVMDPVYASRKFYEHLVAIPGWQSLPLTVAAQRVQRSAYPDAYADDEPLATTVVNTLTGGLGGAGPVSCGGEGISPSGWTVPVKSKICSGFRTADRPTHNGVDLCVAPETEIHAAAAGTVIVSRCDKDTIDTVGTCDRAGNPDAKGCGWFVDILHPGGIITRYCHQIRQPKVQVGQAVAAGEVIGNVGSSGRSSGPHVHYEVHVNADRSKNGAIDPVPWMQQQGAPLGLG